MAEDEIAVLNEEYRKGYHDGQQDAAAADAVDPLRAGPGEGQDEAIEAAKIAVICAARPAYLPLDQAAKVAVEAAYPLIAARVRAEATPASVAASMAAKAAEVAAATQFGYRETLDALMAAAGYVPRAGAVADERQRALSAIDSAIQGELDLHQCAFRELPEKNQIFVQGMKRAKEWVAAGSVPVATPEPIDLGFLSVGESVREDPPADTPSEHRNVDGFCPACEVYWPCDSFVAANVGPAGTPTEPTVKLTRDTLDGGWVAEFAPIPGCMSQGETIPEALRGLADALAETVAAIVDAMDVPAEQDGQR